MSQITLYGFNFERPRFLTVRSLDEQRVVVMWDNPVEGGKIGRSEVGLAFPGEFHIGANGADTLSGLFVPGAVYPLQLRQWLNDTVVVDTSFRATKLNAPGNPQLTVTASGLSFSWTDRSSYETRYNMSIRAIPWSGDTVYAQGHKIAGQDTTSGFLSWNDLFWAWGYLEFSWPILYLELVSKMRQG